jgi:hypothetical protein
MTQGIQHYPDAQSWSLDREPDEDDLQALEPAGRALPVEPAGPVRVQQLGSEDSSARLVTVDDVTGGKLCNYDDRRSRLIVIGVDQPIWLATSQAEVQSSMCAQIPKGVPVEIRGKRKWFARSATPATPANVTVIADFWAN